ncbi:hypothetical protein [Xanthomonas sacchari]|uniref:hypothetical protein n=1 Tax=Xanthomonas sacchari TaxID=56458 RepID=UPI00224EBE12|nr:hypothetical protein [Xanthomonas sacchari]
MLAWLDIEAVEDVLPPARATRSITQTKQRHDCKCSLAGSRIRAKEHPAFACIRRALATHLTLSSTPQLSTLAADPAYTVAATYHGWREWPRQEISPKAFY